MRWFLVLLFSLAACSASPPVPSEAVVPSVSPVPTPQLRELPTVRLPPPTATPLPSPTPAAPTATPLPQYDLVLEDVTLIDGTGAAPLVNQTIAISSGRIAVIAPAGTLIYAAATPVRRLNGATLLPGFINAHVHTRSLSDDELRRWVQAGITTVRDLSAEAEIVQRRDALATDLSVPRMLVAGPMVTVPGGHPIPIYGLSERVLTVRGPLDAAQQINALIDLGVDQIKIAVSGRTDTNYPELSNDEITAITEIARARGVRVTVHVDRASALARAVAHGVNDAAHAPRDRIPDALIAEMVQRGVGMVPTVDVYEALAFQRGNAAEWRLLIMPVMYDNMRRFAEAGGILALGDDYGGAEGTTLGMPLDEIRHWLDAGFTPLEVIRAATYGSALVSGVESDLGTLEVGKIADMLVVDGDPLAEIDALARPLLVLRSGVIVAE